MHSKLSLNGATFHIVESFDSVPCTVLHYVVLYRLLILFDVLIFPTDKLLLLFGYCQYVVNYGDFPSLPITLMILFKVWRHSFHCNRPRWRHGMPHYRGRRQTRTAMYSSGRPRCPTAHGWCHSRPCCWAEVAEWTAVHRWRLTWPCCWGADNPMHLGSAHRWCHIRSLLLGWTY